MTYTNSAPPLRRFFQKFGVTIMFVVIFVCLFLFSSIIYHTKSSHKVYTLLFPSANNKYKQKNFSHLYAEQRKIPIPQVLQPEWTIEERKVYYLLKELIYGPGPGMIRAYPFIPQGSRLTNLVIQNRNLYLDFNASLIQGKSEHYFGTDAVLALIKKVIRFNFPKIENIYFTITGIGMDSTDVRLLDRELEKQKYRRSAQSQTN